jgi:serine/threonine protein kinase
MTQCTTATDPYKHHDTMDGNCVHKVKKGKTGKVYVRKWISIKQFANLEQARKAFEKEVKILRAAQHSNHVIKLIDDYYVRGREFAIVMEAAESDLATVLKTGVRDRHQHQGKFVSWFTCLATALDALHGIGIRHRDIKPENILIRGSRVLLADFGISAMGLKATISTTQKGRESSHTSKWCAPEVLDGGSRDSAADIFSLGAVYLVMVWAYAFWDEMGSLVSTIHPSIGRNLASVYQCMGGVLDGSNPPEAGDAWARPVASLCRKMLDEDPFKRPNAAEVLSSLKPLHVVKEGVPPCKCPKTQTQTDIAELCRSGELNEVKRLLSRSRGDPKHELAAAAIHQASRRQDVGFVEALLGKKSDKVKRALVDKKNYSGQTPLHSAIGNASSGVIRYLMDNGADVSIPDDDGSTALHCAAACGNGDIVGLVLGSRAKRDKKDLPRFVNRRDHSGRTALLCAARRGHSEAARKLVDAGANVRAADHKKRTPLHFAAGCGCLPTLTLLLEGGADVNAEDQERKTPICYAVAGLQTVDGFNDVCIELRVGATML